MPGERPPSGWDVFAGARADDLLHVRDASYEDLCRQVLDTITKYIPPSSPILDVGCGVGALTRKIKAEGYPIVGADIAPKSIVIARRVFGVDCVVGGPLAAYEHHDHQLFGGAVANMVFHCVSDPQTLFRDISSVLTPDSHLIFTVPDAMWVASHQNTLLAVREANVEGFTQHEVTRQFHAGGNSYTGTGVRYFLYDSPVAYLQAASLYFEPIDHIPVATPLDREAYAIGETERMDASENPIAALPDIDMFVLRRI